VTELPRLEISTPRSCDFICIFILFPESFFSPAFFLETGKGSGCYGDGDEMFSGFEGKVGFF
jgi:hypothetical protein